MQNYLLILLIIKLFVFNDDDGDDEIKEVLSEWICPFFFYGWVNLESFT